MKAGALGMKCFAMCSLCPVGIVAFEAAHDFLISLFKSLLAIEHRRLAWCMKPRSAGTARKRQFRNGILLLLFGKSAFFSCS